MERIGIICALTDEARDIIKDMKAVKEEKYFFAQFFSGTLYGKNVVLLCCGIGSDRAKIATNILLSKYTIDYVMILGAAGALSPQIHTGDILLADRIILHKLVVDSEEKNVHYRHFSSHYPLMEKGRKACVSIMPETNVKIGAIVTVEQFIESKHTREILYRESNADCVEMESWHIAEICSGNQVPFIAIRIISDQADSKAQDSFKDNIDSVAEKLRGITLSFIKAG